MRTMYIILSWVGWGWFLVAGVALLITERRRGQATRPGGFPVSPIVDPVAKADVLP